MKTIQRTTSARFGNRFQALVVERRPDHSDCGKVVRRSPWASNLILDAGMDNIASRLVCDLFVACAAGSGTTPVADDSGSVTATTSGTTVTSSGAFFLAGDVGKLLRFDSGEASMIESVEGDTSATLADSLGVSVATAFTMHRVGQTGLTTEVVRTTDYFSGAAQCGTSRSGAVVTHKRTFAFPIETVSQAYSEVGFSHSAEAGANLNMRGLFAGAPITVEAGQQLCVIYEVYVTLAPVTPRANTPVISGWASTSGTEQLTALSISYIDSAGATQSYWGAVSEPSAAKYLAISEDTDALPTFPSAGTALRSVVADGVAALVGAAYVAGSFSRVWSATFAAAEANSDGIRRLFLCDGTESGGDYYENGPCFLFTSAQEKLGTHSLSLAWEFTWERDFS